MRVTAQRKQPRDGSEDRCSTTAWNRMEGHVRAGMGGAKKLWVFVARKSMRGGLRQGRQETHHVWWADIDVEQSVRQTAGRRYVVCKRLEWLAAMRWMSKSGRHHGLGVTKTRGGACGEHHIGRQRLRLGRKAEAALVNQQLAFVL